MITDEEEAKKYFENNSTLHKDAVKEIIAPTIDITKYARLEGETYYSLVKEESSKDRR